MHAFDVLGDPVRRRILEMLGRNQLAAGQITEVIRAEFGISQAAVSQHLKVLRENGFAHAHIQGPKRIYQLRPTPLREVTNWLTQFQHFWEHKLDALETEIVRGKLARSDGDGQD